MQKLSTDLLDPRTRIALTPQTPTYVGPLPIVDEAELRRRNAIANRRRAEREAQAERNEVAA